MKPTPAQGPVVRRRPPLRILGRVAVWLLCLPAALAFVIYAVLLVTPIPLPFVNNQVRGLVTEALPAGTSIELGEMALALENYVWPVIRFRPVVYSEAASGARISMEALEVGFSPIRALWGQPGATVTVVRPHLQVNQDLFGPRLVSFEVVPDPDGGQPTVRIIEGADAFPAVGISPDGVEVQGELPPSAMQMRSDNDWLIFNLEAAEEGIAAIVEQAEQGRFSRLIVKDATLEMNDALYGVFRTFRQINMDIAPTPRGDRVAGSFSVEYGGTVMNGNLERRLEPDGTSRLHTSITNLDFASFMSFVDDPEATTSLVGPAAVSVDVGFDAATHRVRDGVFHVDLTGTDLRVEDDYFPLASSILEIHWEPDEGQFTMNEAQISVGQSTAWVQGAFRMGLDDLYGPIVGVSMQARDVSIWSEAGSPEMPFSSISFQGWSAPLYGATGIDLFQAEKADGARLASRGRVDMLRRGIGFDMTIAGDGISADDLKRLWPYFVAPDARNWFVQSIVGGRLKTSTMRYSFPVGTLPGPGETDKPIPKNSIAIDIAAEGVQLIPAEGMAPITIEGETRFEMRDTALTFSADGATIPTDGGDIAVANFGFRMTSESPSEQIMEISGDLAGGIPAVVAIARQQQPELFEGDGLPVDPDALTGSLTLSMVSTIVVDSTGETKSVDYAINGVLQDFASSAPLEGRTIGNGQLSFVASQHGYRVAGNADIDGLTADVVIEGVIEEDAAPPSLLLSATLDAEDLKKMGFDASEFISGRVKFVARPMPDSSIQIAVDVTDAVVSVQDLGITKARGVSGSIQAEVHQNGDITEVSRIDVAFGDVRLRGSLGVHANDGLQSAEFSSFALSPGDEAQLSLTPVRGGYEVRLRGNQLDLKPMLKRFFDLGEDSTGGPQAASFGDTTIVLDVQLRRALGFYRTTAFNLEVDLALRGTDLQRASLQANFENGSSISITTNPSPSGRLMTVAFNDLGTVLRLLNIYPNIQGGTGTLTIQTITAERADRGNLVLRNFTIVDEANVAQVLGGHQESRQMLSRQNNLTFRSAEVDFVRRSDRVEITEAVLAGDSVGGSARGFIYTDNRQYDITGTYVPLFGINNVFSRLLGPLAGREGEGLFGITFAIQGPLDKPDFRVNPISALAPGAFRRMFEYRAREIPRVE